MTPLVALAYSFLYGLLHGILPDEHTWPITFSYAIGGGSSKEGMKAGLYFSIGFTIQRAIISEVAYLALAPFLLKRSVNGVVYIIVGLAMSVAGWIILKRNRYAHLHLLGHHHETVVEMEKCHHILTTHHHGTTELPGQPPTSWAMIHGFIAGFAFGGLSLFTNTIAAPAMRSAWLGFLPGLFFGLGTMVMLAIIGSFFGTSLRWLRVTEAEIKRIGSQTGGNTLLYGGILFGVAGFVTLMGWDRYSPIDPGYLLITLFTLLIAIPAFLISFKEAVSARTGSSPEQAVENQRSELQ